jgi:hypothetical protein
VLPYSKFGTPAFDGSYLYDLGGFGSPRPSAGDGIEQTVATTIGSTYALSFGLTKENNGSNPGTLLNLIINGSLVETIAVPSNGGLGEFQVPFVVESLNYVATSASTTILFTVGGKINGNHDPVIDAVNFDLGGTASVPEPVTLPLCGISLAGLALVRRLRARQSGFLHGGDSGFTPNYSGKPGSHLPECADRRAARLRL